MVKNIYEIKECPDCGSSEILYNEKKQHVICKDCNVIYEPLTPKEEETYLGYNKSEPKKETKPVEEHKPKQEKPAKTKIAKVEASKSKPAPTESKVRRRRPRDDDGYI